MSNEEILYVKDMNISESEEDEGDIWDDSALNDAYSKALKIANVEVAQRVAMSTNKKDDKSKKDKLSKQNPCKNPQKWKLGMPCRAEFSVDGHEYEATIHRFLGDKECVVRFIGYNNTEMKSLSDLKPTQGKEMQEIQIDEARCERSAHRNERLMSRTADMERTDTGSDMPSPESAGRSSQKKKKSNKKNKKNPSFIRLPQNDFHLPLPNFDLPRNIGSMDMPPPPPPHMFRGPTGENIEDQTLSSMLVSWYMSGYYAGLYKGIKRVKENRED